MVEAVLVATDGVTCESLKGLFTQVIEETKRLLRDSNQKPSDDEIINTLIALMDSSKITLKSYFCFE